MPGSFDLSPVSQSAATQAVPVYVCRFDPDDESNPYTVLSNVRCLRIDYRAGHDPGAARFRYMMDDLAESALGWPSRFEKLFPLDSQGDYVVQADDRLVVLTQAPAASADGSPQLVVLFDGFAEVPQCDASGQGQSVTFSATGVAVRLWDKPIVGRIQRAADDPSTTDGSADVTIGLPARFNPASNSIGALGGYIGNCVAEDGFTTGEDYGDYPVFLEPLILERDEDQTSDWFISDAVKYLIQWGVDNVDFDKYVKPPSFDSLDAVLGEYSAPDGELLNSGDATSANIQIRDFNAANRAVPDALATILGYGGFVMSFVTDTSPDGLPETSLRIQRRDAFASVAPKALYLDAWGATSLDLAKNNATSLSLSRDQAGIVNSWQVETGLKQVEVTVELAPGFTPSAGDATNRKPYFLSSLTNATGAQRRMYRWYIADECGDGHWNAQQDSWETTALDLSGVFPPDDDENPTYVPRYRPGQRTLIAKDAEGRPLKAVLEIQFGEANGDPAVSTDVGEGWLTVPHGWILLHDRLGIELRDEDPDDWKTGNTGLPNGPVVKALLWQATPGSPPTGQTFRLRLTTVIDSDQVIPVLADKRMSSPTQFTRRKSADGNDHFQHCSIAVGSLNYDDADGDGTNPVIVRDDTDVATTHAKQLRAAHEFPRIAGSASVPFITDYYKIGDRIKQVKGRGASLQVNVGADQGETPTFPWVDAFSWDFEGDKQQTILQLSDRRAEPQRSS
jgi:hypothetical protein